VGRRDDESVAGALNEPLFELVGDVLGAATTARAPSRAATITSVTRLRVACIPDIPSSSSSLKASSIPLVYIGLPPGHPLGRKLT
jgi:hypothetical protein